jgi:antitoxin component YwqK of YwqJK toxin-antitoxin module
MNFEKPTGSFKNHKEDGKLDNKSEYDNLKALERTFYRRDGTKKSWIVYLDKDVQQQKGWDETGKEIKNYVVEREAKFKGGIEGWRKYLEKKLNANVAADAGAPEGTYQVKLQFIINPEGYVSNVKAIEIPEKCKPCAAEAVRVISEGPEWQPAIQHNEPVIYQAIQYVSFLVVEEKKKEDDDL